MHHAHNETDNRGKQRWSTQRLEQPIYQGIGLALRAPRAKPHRDADCDKYPAGNGRAQNGLDLVFYSQQHKHHHGRRGEDANPVSYHHQGGNAPVLAAGQDDANGHEDSDE